MKSDRPGRHSLPHQPAEHRLPGKPGKSYKPDHPGGNEKGPKGRHLGSGLILLYEDRDLLVVDKPSGLLSIAAPGSRDKTVYWLLAEYLRHKGEKRRPAVVHRLDRDTSGVMIFAKAEAVKKALMENWDKAVIERRYLALAEGLFAEEEGVIAAPLGEDKSGRVVAVKEGGLAALTRWKRLGAGRAYTLLSLELETGRRNQIRAHLAFLGRPVAGDKKYWAKTDPLQRLCLHAEKIAFYHPKDGKIMEFESPAPEGFARLVPQTQT
jgi:RluA family pseudouridine synthase